MAHGAAARGFSVQGFDRNASFHSGIPVAAASCLPGGCKWRCRGGHTSRFTRTRSYMVARGAADARAQLVIKANEDVNVKLGGARSIPG